MDPGEVAARAFYNSVGGSYAIPEPAAPAAATPLPSPGAAPATPERGGVAEPATFTAEDFYAPAPTRGLVHWDEPAGAPSEFDLPAPHGMLDRSEAGTAAMGRLRDGLAAAGAGVTLARELFSDAVRAQQDGRVPVGRTQAEAELRQHFGDRYDAKIAAAVGLVQRAAQRCPEIVPFLERTGLGNSPEFIRKLAAAAGRRGR